MTNFQYTIDLADVTLRTDKKYECAIYVPPMSKPCKQMFKINRISLFYSWYNITTNNNKLVTSIGTVTITPGLYDITTLLSAIDTALKGFDGSCSCVLTSPTSPELRTVKITCGSVWTLTLSQSTINSVIGFGDSDVTGLSFTGSKVYSIGTRYITFHSEHISKTINTRMTDGRPDYVCFIPVNSVAGSYVEYQPQYPIISYVDQNQSLSNDVMYFMDDEKNIVSFNGIHPIINIEYIN